MVITSDQYNIYVGNRIWDELSDFLNQPEYQGRNIFIMADENTFKHCLPIMLNKIELLQNAEVIEVANGEENKSIDVCIQVWQMLTDKGADRKALYINLGGGVISDMGGFIAATYKRGIDFINIPTTLLSQVDASVGGKVGIDLNGIKNQIGVFCNPKAVFVYPTFVDSLDKRQILSGLAEILKHGLIADKGYWNKIKTADIENTADLTKLIIKSIEIKNAVVLSDPKEKGIRKTLNFGHTIGHAVETYSLLKNRLPLLHGEAIAIGIVCEAYLSHRISGLSNAELQEITSYIRSHYEPYIIPEESTDVILKLMLNDKKNEKGAINFTLLKAIGQAEIDFTINTEIIEDALDYYRNEFTNKALLN